MLSSTTVAVNVMHISRWPQLDQACEVLLCMHSCSQTVCKHEAAGGVTRSSTHWAQLGGLHTNGVVAIAREQILTPQACLALQQASLLKRVF